MIKGVYFFLKNFEYILLRKKKFWKIKKLSKFIWKWDYNILLLICWIEEKNIIKWFKKILPILIIFNKNKTIMLYLNNSQSHYNCKLNKW